jgi:hypothetical protein
MSGPRSAVSCLSQSSALASIAALGLLTGAAAAGSAVGTEVRPGPPVSLRAEQVIDPATLDGLGIPHPSRLTYDANHCLYILDAAARRIVKLDPAGKPLWDLGGYGDDDQSFSLPVDLAIDRRQSLLVLDRGKNAVVAFDPAGHFLGVRTFGESVARDASDPGARLLVDPFGELWLLDPRERDLIPLDDRLERSRRSRFLAPEASAGSPAAIVFLPTSGGWVFDAAGRKLRRFGNNGQMGAAVADSLAPSGAADLAVDPAGFLYAADRDGQRLLVLDDGGGSRLERVLGGPGIPWRPSAIAVSRSDRLAILDSERGEIQILTVERGRAP